MAVLMSEGMNIGLQNMCYCVRGMSYADLAGVYERTRPLNSNQPGIGLAKIISPCRFVPNLLVTPRQRVLQEDQNIMCHCISTKILRPKIIYDFRAPIREEMHH